MNPSASPPIDACLFDVGGVLVKIDFSLAFAHWAHCAQVPEERVAARFKADAAYEAHERGEIDCAQYFATLRTSLGIDLPDHEFEAGWNAIFKVCALIGSAPARIAFFDDLPENVAGAQQAGLQAFHVPAAGELWQLVQRILTTVTK